MATVLEAINKGLRLRREPEVVAASFATDTFANSLLEGASYVLREIYKVNPRWGFLESNYSLSTVVNQANYAVSTLQSGLRVHKIRTMRHEDNYPIDLITKEQFERQVLPTLDLDADSLTTGKPFIAYPQAESLYFYFTPNSVQTIQIFYAVDFTTALLGTSTGTNDLTSTLIVNEGDMNIFVSGMKWIIADLLKADDRGQEWQEWQRQLRLASQDNQKQSRELELDPFYAAFLRDTP